MDEQKQPKSSTFSNMPDPRKPGEPILPYVTKRPKRRRKGQLNDGEWAPGYGPNAKKK